MAERYSQEDAPDAPDFSVLDSTGKKFTLSNYRNSRTVVLVFNRGFG
jgi:peroxiredoxin